MLGETRDGPASDVLESARSKMFGTAFAGHFPKRQNGFFGSLHEAKRGFAVVLGDPACQGDDVTINSGVAIDGIIHRGRRARSESSRFLSLARIRSKSAWSTLTNGPSMRDRSRASSSSSFIGPAESAMSKAWT